MIIFDVVAKVAADSTMDTLLGVGAGADKRIYPIQAPDNAPSEYILYANAGIGLDETLDETRLRLVSVSNDYEKTVNIAKRLIAMFDKVNPNITSSDYYIYYSELSGELDILEPEQGHFEKNLFFNFKYKKKT